MERRLATILAIDVVGYSRMMQADAAGLLAALNAIFRDLVKPTVEARGGRIVKLLGDGALAEFSSAYQTLEAAVVVQQRLQGPDKPHSHAEPIQLRMGIHAGDLLVEGQDLFGDGVNIAARLQAAAEPGGILLSKTVLDLAGHDLPFKFRHEGMRRFKNISQPIETLAIDPAGQSRSAARNTVAASLAIRTCTSKDGQRLAWTKTGTGLPIVKAPNWIGHLELDWRNPSLAHLFASIASGYELIYFDARGNGLSDWAVENISFEAFVDDLECVFDAAAVERAPILAISQGCAVAAAFAARCPERVSALIMIGSFPVGRAKRQSKKDRERALALKAMMTAGWDDDYPSLRDLVAEIIVPLASTEDRRRYAEDMKEMISPENLGKYRDVIDHLDVTDLLPKVQAPCLVMHCKGDRMQPIDQGRLMAAGLPNARFIAYDSNNHDPTENDPCWPLMEREIHSFLEAHC